MGKNAPLCKRGNPDIKIYLRRQRKELEMISVWAWEQTEEWEWVSSRVRLIRVRLVLFNLNPIKDIYIQVEKKLIWNGTQNNFYFFGSSPPPGNTTGNFFLFFLFFFLGWRIPILLTGLSGWRLPDLNCGATGQKKTWWPRVVTDRKSKRNSNATPPQAEDLTPRGKIVILWHFPIERNHAARKRLCGLDAMPWCE